MTRESILTKIKHLMAKTVERGCTVEEAASAAALAQRLLFQHHLSESDVDLGNTESDRAYGRQSHSVGGARSMRAWRQDLLSTVARHNFCRVLLPADGRRGEHVTIVGRETDMEFVRWLFDYLVNEFDRLGRLWVIQHAPPNNREPAMRAFGIGATREVSRRLAEQRRKDETQSAKSVALVVVSNAALTKAFDAFFPPSTRHKVPAPRAHDASAYHAGAEVGRRVSLNRPVGGSASRGSLNA